jgi:hypothetical protein
MHTLLSFNIYVMEPKKFIIYFKRGIVHALNNFGHKQYPSNSLTNIIQSIVFMDYFHEGIPYRFCLGNAIPLQEPMVFMDYPNRVLLSF